jgi:hypothetical protein
LARAVRVCSGFLLFWEGRWGWVGVGVLVRRVRHCPSVLGCLVLLSGGVLVLLCMRSSGV